MRLHTSIINTILGIILFPLAYQIIPTSLFNGLVFYRGLVACLLVFICHWIVMIIFSKNQNTSQGIFSLNPFSVSTIVLCFNACFLTIFPVTVDRSVTTFLLEEIEKKPGMTAEELEKIMIDDYIVRRKAIKRRIEEQLVTGNITYENGQVTLNKQGKGFLNLCKMIRTVFKLPDRSKVEE